MADARREAEAAFGDGTVFLERYLRDPRHIEVQVLADAYGDTVALFERECSIQRRHQKIIEEAPSPVVTPLLRARLVEAAIAAARAVEYVNAGTVEFVVDQHGEPFFLEMNTRLQVEHPVTEAVTGLDLVRLQLLIAGGAALPDEVHDAVAAGPQGHAIEARLYAEDPAQRWMPSTGKLERFEVGPPPGAGGDAVGPGGGAGTGFGAGAVVRVDTGVESGSRGQPALRPHVGQGDRPRAQPDRSGRSPLRCLGLGPYPRGRDQSRPLWCARSGTRGSWPGRPTPVSSSDTTWPDWRHHWPTTTPSGATP